MSEYILPIAIQARLAYERIGNRLEPPWYLCFVAITVSGFTQPEFPWLLLLAVCEPLKWALIGYRLWHVPYVGAFYRQLARKEPANRI